MLESAPKDGAFCDPLAVNAAAAVAVADPAAGPAGPLERRLAVEGAAATATTAPPFACAPPRSLLERFVEDDGFVSEDEVSGGAASPGLRLDVAGGRGGVVSGMSFGLPGEYVSF